MFTKVHVVISLIAIFAGIVVMFGLLTSKRLNGWTVLFLITTVLTSVTGFFFPFHGFTPAIGVGILSLVVLAIAIFTRFGRRLAGASRWIYVVTAMLALYLNVFVLIVQLFQKVPALKALAPTQAEPPFLIAQLGALVIFVVLTVLAAIRFRPSS
jgi:K+-transporting ATPase A subunit